MESGTLFNLNSIWGSSDTDVFAVGEGGTILHYDGNQWNSMNSGTSFHLSGIWGSSSTDVFAVGEWGTILHYDGNQWNSMISGTDSLYGIWGSSSTDVFAVGSGDISSGEYTLLHYDGDNWKANTTVPLSLYAIWGSPEGDIFAAGDYGILRCANCQQATQEFYCCSYTRGDGTTSCEASLSSYPFEECKKLAKNAGATQFKWGQVNKATAEMCWAGGTCGEVQEYLPVTLDNLTVSTLENQLVIQWDTASEINNLGMNLWCAQLAENQFDGITQLNSQLIPTKAILPQLGASYSSANYPEINTRLKPGIQHCTLEDIDAGGQCTLHCDYIKTVVIGDDNSIADAKLNEINAKARALCNESQQAGVCLAQRLAPNQPSF